MRRAVLVVLAALPFAAHAASAPESAPAGAPRLMPTRDVAVVYRTEQGDRTLEQRVRWSAAEQRMRIDPPAPGLFVLIDYAAHRMELVRERDRSVVEMAAPAAVPGLGAAASGAYERLGSETVAGLACTEWRSRDLQGGDTRICATEDGVVLKVWQGDRVLATASQVRYAPQEAALFRAPAGYARLAPSTR